MKKLMRIALVFALAGATLVGCTKDYSGDISDLNKKVSEQATAISALQTQVATALSEAQKALSEAQAAAQAAKAAEESAEIDALAARVTTLEAAMQSVNDVLAGKANAADLTAAKAALEGAIASINDVLAGKADKADLATVKAALEALQASVAENKEAFDATKTALEASIATINAALEGKADKAEVAATYATIAALTETNNSLAELQATVEELAETVAANKKAGETADESIIADLKKANEAIENAAAAASQAVADLKAEVTETLKGYYTKAEIDALVDGLNTSLDNLKKYIDGKLLGITILVGEKMELGYAEFNGVFSGSDTKHKKAEWNGPMADKLPAEGSIITSSLSGELIIQVTPADYDITKAEFSVKNLLGVDAPFVFGEPVAYEELTLSTKGSAAGVYVLPYSAENLDEEDVKLALEFAGKTEDTEEIGAVDCALFVNGNIASAYGAITVDVMEVTRNCKSGYAFDPESEELDGEETCNAVVKPEDPEYVFDYYISKLTSDKDIATRFGLKINDDRQSISYDSDLAAAYVKKNGETEFKFSVASLNLKGYVDTVKTVTFTIKPETKEPYEHETITFEYAGDPIVHTATIVANQQIVPVDFYDAFEEWGFGDEESLEYLLNWEDAGYKMSIEKQYKEASDADHTVVTDVDGTFAITSPYVVVEKGEAVSGLGVANNYFDGKDNEVLDRTGKTSPIVYVDVIFKTEEEAPFYEITRIPVQLVTPNPEEWIKWEQTRPVYTYENGDNELARSVATSWLTAETYKEYNPATKKFDDKTYSVGFDWKDTKIGNEDLEFPYTLDNKTATYAISGLKVNAIGRDWALAAKSFNVISLDNGGADNGFKLTFTDPVSVNRIPEDHNFWFAINEAFGISDTGKNYDGTFSFAGKTGANNLIAIDGEAEISQTRVDLSTRAELAATGYTGGESVTGYTVKQESTGAFKLYKLQKWVSTGWWSGEWQDEGSKKYDTSTPDAPSYGQQWVVANSSSYAIYRMVDTPVVEIVTVAAKGADGKYTAYDKGAFNVELVSYKGFDVHTEEVINKVWGIKVTPNKPITDVDELKITLKFADEALTYASTGKSVTGEDGKVSVDFNVVFN